MKTLLLFFCFLLIASTINAGQPFAPKAKSYSQNSFKKYGKKKTKNAFSCTKNRKVNRKGLMR